MPYKVKVETEDGITYSTGKVFDILRFSASTGKLTHKSEQKTKMASPVT